MLRTGHRSTAGVRSYKRTTSMLKEKTSNVFNDCTNVVKMTSADVEGPVPKKRKMEREILVPKAAVNTSKTGHCFSFYFFIQYNT